MRNIICLYFTLMICICFSGSCSESPQSPVVPVENKGTLPQPLISAASGAYYNDFSISITCSNTNAVIRYTTNGDIPTEASAVYTNNLMINASQTVTARAFLSGWTVSDSVRAEYNMCVAPISFNYSSGNYWQYLDLKVSGATSNARITYTMDGSIPSHMNGSAYSNGIVVYKFATVKALAEKDGYSSAACISASFGFANIVSKIVSSGNVGGGGVSLKCYYSDGSTVQTSHPMFSGEHTQPLPERADIFKVEVISGGGIGDPGITHTLSFGSITYYSFTTPAVFPAAGTIIWETGITFPVY